MGAGVPFGAIPPCSPRCRQPLAGDARVEAPIEMDRRLVATEAVRGVQRGEHRRVMLVGRGRNRCQWDAVGIDHDGAFEPTFAPINR